jgi:hypothetical protein
MSDLPYNPLPSTLRSKSAETDQPMSYKPLPATLGMRVPPSALRDQVHLAGTHDSRISDQLMSAEDLSSAPAWQRGTPGDTNAPLGYHSLSKSTAASGAPVQVPCWRYHQVLAPRLITTLAELGGLGDAWSATPFPPKIEDAPMSIDDRLEEHAELVDLLLMQAQPGEKPADTIARLVDERDDFARKFAAASKVK